MNNPTIYIGERENWGQSSLFGMAAPNLRQHLYIIGKTGVGKTTLLRNMIIQHLGNGSGLALLDPHGDLAEELLDHYPPSRADDLVYFNPSDLEFPIGLNLLANVPPDDRHLAVKATRGRVLADSPLMIAVDRSQQAEVTVTGGLGYVPITFTGLKQHRGYVLERFSAGDWQPVDQSVHGHDFWQVNFDADRRTFRLSFNVPLDNHGASGTHRLRLRPDPAQS